MRLRIDNKTARRLWLATTGLATTPTGPLDVLNIIKQLGFVQLDSIRNVTRAHHHILWSRNQHYREPMLWDLLAQQRALFEHFTHDASMLPMEYFPMWTRQFSRMRDRIEARYPGLHNNGVDHATMLARIENEGPLSTRAFDTKAVKQEGMWSRPPHKRALDYLWYCGKLTTSHRENFVKFYDLTQRVIPPVHFDQRHDSETQIDWLCRQALERIAFGSEGDIKRFWDAVDSTEVKAWVQRNAKQLVAVDVQARDGDWAPALAANDIEARIANLDAPTSRLRLLSPFDPAIRDRTRLSRLFGFDYRIEIFVPATKRKWGYYVYPMLEGDRFVGRADLKADRNKGLITVQTVWLEPKVKWTPARANKFDAELNRIARFIGASQVHWNCRI